VLLQRDRPHHRPPYLEFYSDAALLFQELESLIHQRNSLP
jgi:hypothetical protein